MDVGFGGQEPARAAQQGIIVGVQGSNPSILAIFGPFEASRGPNINFLAGSWGF